MKLHISGVQILLDLLEYSFMRSFCSFVNSFIHLLAVSKLSLKERDQKSLIHQNWSHSLDNHVRWGSCPLEPRIRISVGIYIILSVSYVYFNDRNLTLDSSLIEDLYQMYSVPNNSKGNMPKWQEKNFSRLKFINRSMNPHDIKSTQSVSVYDFTRKIPRVS